VTTRTQLVAEAQTWRGTPYEMNQCVKGAGADCGRWMFGALQNCGLIDAATDVRTIEIFGNNWSCNTDDEKYRRYIFRMLRHSRSILTGICQPTHNILPGCLVLVRPPTSRAFDHGGLVLSWPRMLHSIPDYGVSECNASTHWLWAHKAIEAFDPFAGAE